MQIPFTKMAGAGNDFIIVDARRHQLAPLTRQWPAISRSLCDRHTGIGADGLLVLEMSRRANVKMRVFNSDGSEAEMCGNGARCVARYIAQGARGASVSIETRAGVVEATVRGDEVAMRMMDPTGLRLGLSLDVGGRTVRLLGFVNTGVPHAVVPVERIDSIDVNRIGRALRYHRTFAPRGSNVNFVQADTKRMNRLRVRTYERGAEEETMACGTGVAASAVLYALQREGRGRGNGVLSGRRASCRHRMEVETRSGDVLTVAFTVAGEGCSRRVSDVVLRGSAARIFDGTVGWSLKREG